MKLTKSIMTLGLASALCLGMSATAFAGQWVQDSAGWWWQNDDGTWPASSWQWLDGNQDGTEECYYFLDNGYLAVNTTIEGYTVNSDGAWTVDGTVQTQAQTQNQTENALVTDSALPQTFAELVAISGVQPDEEGEYNSMELMNYLADHYCTEYDYGKEWGLAWIAELRKLNQSLNALGYHAYDEVLSATGYEMCYNEEENYWETDSFPWIYVEMLRDKENLVQGKVWTIFQSDNLSYGYWADPQ